jgi:hypothetical protein
MAFQYSVAVQNGGLDSRETTIGTSPIIRHRTGAPPANCAAADTGTVLDTMTLPSDWMNAASGGVKTKLGTWTDAAADASGAYGHFRMYDSGGTVCHMQGTVGVSAADMITDSATATLGQAVTVNTFTLTAGNQ